MLKKLMMLTVTLLFSTVALGGNTTAKIDTILFVETATKGLVYIYPKGV